MKTIKCRTLLTNKNIKALAKYHTHKQKRNKQKSVLIFALGIFLLIISIINSYGLWMKYHEIKSTLYIILKSSVLYLLSFIILHTSIWGTTRKLYIDLYNYFTRQKAEFIDYTISDEGITLVLAKTSTMYNWDSINFVESDSNYYYFTCNGKCSLIDKNDMTLDIQNIFESIIFENNVLFYNLY